MKKQKHTINDGLRMIGQLLRHHPAVGFFAYDGKGYRRSCYDKKACSFCLVGAIDIVSEKLGLNRYKVSDRITRLVKTKALANYWDGNGEWSRVDLTLKLCDLKAR